MGNYQEHKRNQMKVLREKRINKRKEKKRKGVFKPELLMENRVKINCEILGNLCFSLSFLLIIEIKCCAFD